MTSSSATKETPLPCLHHCHECHAFASLNRLIYVSGTKASPRVESRWIVRWTGRTRAVRGPIIGPRLWYIRDEIISCVVRPVTMRRGRSWFILDPRGKGIIVASVSIIIGVPKITRNQAEIYVIYARRVIVSNANDTSESAYAQIVTTNGTWFESYREDPGYLPRSLGHLRQSEKKLTIAWGNSTSLNFLLLWIFE